MGITRDQKRAETPEDAVRRNERIAQGEGEALETAVGAMAGAAAGIVAGPIGIAAGAALGAAAGAVLGHQIRKANHEEAEQTRALDAGDVDMVTEAELEGNDDRPSLEKLDAELEGATTKRF